MDDSFKTHINKFVKMSDDEFAKIISYFKVQHFKKKENLLNEGQVCKASYFVTKGILRKFFINGKGVEQTTEFAIENWWMTETFSFINQTPSEFFIQAVENTEVLVLHRDAHDKMLDAHPLMEKYFRCVYQRTYAAAQRRNKFRYEHSREELYHFFRKVQPEFLQRVPQYLVASYLGFTPEYLSEIRRKSIS
ncbi:cyclic nucleotide-binding protein [Emticicia aquatilis]|uniref:Cyclic nucleotide-binding protein n=1 Tax=Emticicia aquatilis TaxID=1537369 RepID=A0A916YN15_9BACT|nr:Crp/Fnr family transcriptional regulator [Emticicia aquatilis]GGD52772.1 cyclic nucleotide-binding protein [Emticicia aquatilis]